MMDDLKFNAFKKLKQGDKIEYLLRKQEADKEEPKRTSILFFLKLAFIATVLNTFNYILNLEINPIVFDAYIYFIIVTCIIDRIVWFNCFIKWKKGKKTMEEEFFEYKIEPKKR